MSKTEEVKNRRPLTKMQADHAIRRLAEAKVKLETKAREVFLAKNPEPKFELEQPEQPSGIKKLDLIYAGKAKLKPRKEVTYYTDFHEAFVYPDFEKAMKDFEAKRDLANKIQVEHAKRLTAALKPIEIRFNAAVDAIMLGDAEQAMAIVERFAQGR